MDAKHIAEYVNVLQAENTIMKAELAKLRLVNENLVESASRRKGEKRMLSEIHQYICNDEQMKRRSVEFLRNASDSTGSAGISVTAVPDIIIEPLGIQNPSSSNSTTHEIQPNTIIAKQTPLILEPVKEVVVSPRQPPQQQSKPKAAPVVVAAPEKPAAAVPVAAPKPAATSAVKPVEASVKKQAAPPVVVAAATKPAAVAKPSAPVATAAASGPKKVTPPPAPVQEIELDEEPDCLDRDEDEEQPDGEVDDDPQEGYPEEGEIPTEEEMYEEVEAEVEEEQDGEGVIEYTYKGKVYYATNTTDGQLYAKLLDGDIGMEVGHFVDGVVHMNPPPQVKKTPLRVNK